LDSLTVNNSFCHGLSVTDCNGNGVLSKFMAKAKEINIDHKDPFSVLDYPELSKVYFRQVIHRLGNNIIKVGKGRPQFYKIRGVKLPGDSKLVTLEPMGVNSERIQSMLESVSHQPPMIHDIKLRIDSAIAIPHATKDKNNSSIIVKYDTNSDINTKVLIYPNTAQVDLGCSYKPLIYNVDTIWNLHEHLSKLSSHLTTLSGRLLPQVNDWIITHYHFNKDGSEEVNGKNFHFTVKDVNTGLIRFYSKLMEDGKRIPRLEQIRMPHTTLKEEMKQAMFSEGLN